MEVQWQMMNNRLFISDDNGQSWYGKLYDRDWNSLMLVWKKLKDWKKKEYDADHPKEFEAFKEDWMLSCYCVDIIGAHQTAYNAILWYNSQKETIKP